MGNAERFIKSIPVHIEGGLRATLVELAGVDFDDPVVYENQLDDSAVIMMVFGDRLEPWGVRDGDTLTTLRLPDGKPVLGHFRPL